MDDQLVTAISRWLARHGPDEDLRRELEGVEDDALELEQAEAVRELRAELEEGTSRAELEMVARETLEAVALGG
ncbi:MAG TPA: hypothetical protein VE753_00340 [Gaiellaceae bacterium]|nr:hypothetical protein [Gaiellaceae bacterium]